jgi:hypothetical protein
MLICISKAAITYGDPMAGERTKALGGWGCLPESRTQVNCAKGDGVCTGAFSISVAHLSYTADGSINKGVNFAATIINGGKLGGNPDGACKYGINISDLKGVGGAPPGAGGAPPKSGGGGGAPKGKGNPKGGAGGIPTGGGISAPPKSTEGAESSDAAPKSTGGAEESAPKGGEESSTPPDAAPTSDTPAEPAEPAVPAAPEMDGMRF